MEEEVRELINQKNYEKALDGYNVLLEQKYCRAYLLGKADCLILMGQLREAMEYYKKVLSERQEYESEHLANFIFGLTEFARSSVVASEEETKEQGLLSCAVCESMLFEPVTLSCGHSTCFNCLQNRKQKTCSVCGEYFSLENKKYNVTLQAFVMKYFQHKCKSVQLRREGNLYFARKDFTQALSKYAEAESYDSSDYLLQSKMSFALSSLMRFEEALDKADRSCKLKPSWPKGYYSKACALIGLGRNAEAAVAFVQCLVRDQNNEAVKNSLMKVVHDMFTECKKDELEQLFEKLLSDQEGAQTSEKKSERTYGLWDCENMTKECMVEDMECTLCCRLYHEPVTTPCGHVFCRSCLNRSLDHRPYCPICRYSLAELLQSWSKWFGFLTAQQDPGRLIEKHFDSIKRTKPAGKLVTPKGHDRYLANRKQVVTEALQQLIVTCYPTQYEERKKQHEEELARLASIAGDNQEDVPIFVCTLALPTLPCPLHVFEPRYRLMMRRCLESGARQFGMCLPTADNSFADFGCMLEIRDAQFYQDGRSLINTIGGRRFKVLERGMQDGYHIAKVQWLTEDEVPEDERADLHELHTAVFNQAKQWFDGLPLLVRRRITSQCDEMPAIEHDLTGLTHGPRWLWWFVSILPLRQQKQLSILAMTSLKERLQTLQEIILTIGHT